MAMMESTMLPLQNPAPDFTLPDTVSGRELRLADVRGERGTLVMFICNHCPYVVLIADALAALGVDYLDCGIGIVAICANDAGKYPDDAPDKMAAFARARGFRFPYCHDESQDVARAYHAVCTPDFFLFDADLALASRGQFDDARPRNGKTATGRDMRAALDALVAGRPVPAAQTPSQGCSIKWRQSP
jgi:peroxiredoxin